MWRISHTGITVADLHGRLSWMIMLSPSSSSSAPIGEHSRLHKLFERSCARIHTVFETKVMGPKVELYCTDRAMSSCPPWSTCPAIASPIRWRTIDGCSKNVRVVLWWVGSLARCPKRRSRLFAITEVTGTVLRLTSSLVISNVYGICNIRLRHHWSNASRRRLEASHTPRVSSIKKYLFIFLWKIVHKVQTKIKTKGRKTKANPYGSSLHTAWQLTVRKMKKGL